MKRKQPRRGFDGDNVLGPWANRWGRGGPFGTDQPASQEEGLALRAKIVERIATLYDTSQKPDPSAIPMQIQGLIELHEGLDQLANSFANFMLSHGLGEAVWAEVSDEMEKRKRRRPKPE